MFCQLSSCNLFTLHVCYLLWRDTTSETMAPGPLFYIDYNLVYLLFIITRSMFRSTFNINTLYMFNSLVNNKAGRLTTFLESWEQERVCVLCAGPCLLKRQTTSNLLIDFQVLLVGTLFP